MSKTWTMDCQECGGCRHRLETFHPKVERNADGKTATAICAKCKKRVSSTYKPVGCMFLIADPCPKCSGSGGFNLVVACGQSGWDLCDLDMDAFCTGDKPSNCKESYRPLTVEEVDELTVNISGFKKLLSIDKSPIDIINEGDVIYKGSPVKLMPKVK